MLDSLDVTRQFWKYILIPKRILNRQPKVYPRNAIIFKNILLFGFQGEGKTAVANAIAYKFKRYYGEENVNATMSENGNLDIILRQGFDDRLVNVVFVDNLTMRKIDNSTLADYFMCRHLVSRRFDRYNGYIFSILSLHRFFSIPTELRTNMDGIIIRNSSMNPYDRSFLKRLIGEEGLEILEELEAKRLYQRSLMNWNYFASKYFSGLVRINPSNRQNFRIIDIKIY